MPMPVVSSFDEQLGIAKEHLLEHVTDHSHFIARWLTELKKKANTNTDEVTIAKVLCNLLAVWLCISDRAGFTVNFILVGVPIMLYFAYPDEKASDEDMLIYWTCYGAVTLFDFVFQPIPGWFAMKLACFCLFFLRPWQLAAKIRLVLHARQLYLAAMDGSDIAQQSLQEGMRQIPMSNEMVLAQLLAPQQAVRSDPETLPPSLLAPKAGTTATRRDVPTTNEQRAPTPGRALTADDISTYLNLNAQPKPKIPTGEPSVYSTGAGATRTASKERQ